MLSPGKRLAGVALFSVAALAGLRLRYLYAGVAPDLRHPALPLMTVPYGRRTLPFLRLAYRFASRPGPGAGAAWHDIGGSGTLRAQVVTPVRTGTDRPGVLWLHAGGMIAGSPQIETALAAELARDLDAVVVAPAYRLAPEHPFPAQLDDAMTALYWLRANAAGLGVDAGRVAVVGASAGGGLTALVAQRAYDEGVQLRAQAMIYPMLDDRTALRDRNRRRGRLVWTASSNRFAWSAYEGERMQGEVPRYFSAARRGELGGLAPAWIGVGDLDLFYEEDVDYARRLERAGVQTTLHTVQGMYHAADGLRAGADSMRAFTADMVQHLRRHLEGLASTPGTYQPGRDALQPGSDPCVQAAGVRRAVVSCAPGDYFVAECPDFLDRCLGRGRPSGPPGRALGPAARPGSASRGIRPGSGP